MSFPNFFINPLVDFVLKEITPAYRNKKALIRFKEEILPNYLEYCKNENGKTKTFLHRENPVEIYQIFQHTKLIYQNDITYDDDITRLFDKTNSISISGAAGSGKSMLVKHFVLTCLSKRYGIPIVINLRNVNNKDFTIIREIQRILYKRNPSTELIKDLLYEGKFILLFDGYDEISLQSHRFFTDQFIDFIRYNSKNKFVLTSRPYSGADNLPIFHNYTIKKYSREQVENFIRKQIEVKEICDNIILSLNNCEETYINSYLTNPLILSIFILISQKTTKIPTKQKNFYRRVIDTLFEEHDAITKNNHVRKLQSNLNQEQIERVLQLFSIFSYFSQKFMFDKKYFFKQLNKIKKINKKNKSIVSIENFDNAKLLYDLKVTISLLKENEGEYSFIHRSLQEYFIVSLVYSLDRYKTQEVMYGKILDRIKNRKSHEIHTLTILFEEMDKTNYYKYLLAPCLKSITSNVYDNTNEKEGYYKLLQFIVKDYSIRYDSDLKAHDNFVTLDHTWLFAIESRNKFIKVVDLIKKLLNSNKITSKIDFNNPPHKDVISRILIHNSNLESNLRILHEDIVKYSSDVNTYVKDSELYNVDIVDML